MRRSTTSLLPAAAALLALTAAAPALAAAGEGEPGVTVTETTQEGPVKVVETTEANGDTTKTVTIGPDAAAPAVKVVETTEGGETKKVVEIGDGGEVVKVVETTEGDGETTTVVKVVEAEDEDDDGEIVEEIVEEHHHHDREIKWFGLQASAIFNPGGGSGRVSSGDGRLRQNQFKACADPAGETACGYIKGLDIRAQIFETPGAWSYPRVVGFFRTGFEQGRVLFQPGSEGKPRGDAVYTTRLHRWFGAYRPHLFPTLEYVEVHPARWAFRIPKANTPALAAAFESRLQSKEPRLGASLARHETLHPLHFKRSAYNWLTSCAEPPPCFDAEGRPAPQTKFSTVHFHDAESRDLALLLLNGRIALAWWFLVGDDFDFTRWMIAEFPCDLAAISGTDRDRLLALSAELQTAMRANVSFKLNAGKRVGNYNLTRCRPITDQSDAIFLGLFGFTPIRADLELLQAQVIRTE